MTRREPRNLHATAMPDLVWVGDQAIESLHVLFRTAETRAINTIAWYLRHKRGKAWWSRGLRAAAILLGVAGGLTPLVHSANPHVVDLSWGFVALGASAGCVLFDRFFGYSSSWMRYMLAVAAIQRALGAVQHKWARAWAEIGAGPISPEQREGLLAIIAELVDTVGAQVESETTQWVAYLSEQLERLRGVIDAAREGPRLD
jgi:hypothetical protein